MLTITAVLFAIAAIGGLTLAILQFTRNSAPTPLAIVHGLFAATGLILLIISIAQGQTSGLHVASLIIFLIAAVGGFILFLGYQIRNKPLPKPLILIHGSAAVTAFVLLVIFLAKS
jgi:hypothetical protein